MHKKTSRATRAFQRLVGVAVVAVGLLGIVTFLLMLTTTSTTLITPTTHDLLVASEVDVLYSWQAPPPYAILAAVGLGIAVAAFFVWLELRDINLSRRSNNAGERPLAPRVLMQQTAGVFFGEVTVTVLIPAHNEEDGIGQTLDALDEQDRKADRVIVVADNCSDRTVEIALARGFEVIETVGNAKKKAGALNQVLPRVLAGMGPNDTVMIMDADTRLRPGFLAAAVRRFTDDRGLSAIGGLFYGEPGHGLLGQLQRNEYIRYSRDINRRGGKVFVLTGTSSIFRADALRTVARERGNALPGTNGDVYDTHALTEDNELTIALKTLGGLMISPDACMVETELMPTLRTLWRQRLRWQRGALENIATYGVNGTTTRYWSQQLGITYAIFALWSFFLLIVIQLLATDEWIWYPFWVIVGAIFMTERVVTVWKGGWQARGLAILLVPELLYDFFIDLIFLKGVAEIALRRNASWGTSADQARA